MQRLQRRNQRTHQQPGDVLQRQGAHGVAGDAFLHDRAEGHARQRQQCKEHPHQGNPSQIDPLIDHHDQPAQAQAKTKQTAPGTLTLHQHHGEDRLHAHDRGHDAGGDLGVQRQQVEDLVGTEQHATGGQRLQHRRPPARPA
ncbi:hypothetical protein D3C84_701530 [compost metagenome]